jgi:maltose/moltooligosaccharide transporter
MNSKPRLHFWQIWNMSFGFLGIQFGFALQNANMSRIFQTLGAPLDEISILWLAAPTTGLLIQPIIGYLSDRTWNRLGRRRPYFLAGAILASLALIAMPGASVLWVAAGLLWILDASINVSMEPFRALVADMLPSRQRTTGFAVQSFFIGTGAVVASALPYIFTNWLHVSNTASTGKIPPSVEYSFYLGAFAFIAAVLWTVIKTKEYPPTPDGHTTTANPSRQTVLKALHEIGTDFKNMPQTMIRLALVQYFSWFALFAMWLYTTSAVTSHVFGTTDPTSKLYNQGADWVGILFAAYNGFAAILAFLLPPLANLTSRKTVHSISLGIGGLGLLSFYFIHDQYTLLMSMLAVGLAWASILSMPYAILAGSIPARKMGIYMGIFNFFIVIPQITAAGILGWVVKNVFADQAIYMLVVGGVSLFVAALLVMFVEDEDQADTPAEEMITEVATEMKV